MTLPLAPLRERPADIVPLTRHFVSKYAKRLNLDQVELSIEAIQRLSAYPWPGNIRELENVIHRALLTLHGNILHSTDLNLPIGKDMEVVPAPPAKIERPTALIQYLNDQFREGVPRLLHDDVIATTAVRAAFDHAGHNQVQTAFRLLGISRNVLHTTSQKAVHHPLIPENAILLLPPFHGS